jgi:hypothetical protein
VAPHAPAAIRTDEQKQQESSGKSGVFVLSPESGADGVIPPRGVEYGEESPGKGAIRQKGGATGGAVGGRFGTASPVPDLDLRQVISAWPNLCQTQRDRILALAASGLGTASK